MIMPVAQQQPATERQFPRVEPVTNENDRPSNGDLTKEAASNVVRLFKLLSDETRVRILFHLSRLRELHVRALCERLGQSQPAVSHHLALLREADLIRARRDGKHNFYRLTPGTGRQMLNTFFSAIAGDNGRFNLEGFVLRYLPELSDE